MDHRNRLRIPENFAYIMRSGGADFRGLEFQISFAIGVGGVRVIALIGHDHCVFAATSEIVGAGEFVRSQARHLRLQYPKVLVAPLMYGLQDGMLYQLEDSDENR